MFLPFVNHSQITHMQKYITTTWEWAAGAGAVGIAKSRVLLHPIGCENGMREFGKFIIPEKNVLRLQNVRGGEDLGSWQEDQWQRNLPEGC